MRVYFPSGDNQADQKRYHSLASAIKRLGHTVVTDERELEAGKHASLTPQVIFQREKQNIEESDCVVAEVTHPSSAIGGEIVYALVHNKPVLALFYKDADNLLSPMIAGNPSDHLYLEHYEDDNASIVLKHFFEEVKIIQQRKGKLIVIDGGDGSGKATQSQLLKTYLESHGKKVKYMDFPRYYSSFHGRVVGRFLTGEFGSLDAVSPYLAALAYALDRASAKEEMDTWLSHGGVLLSNRYATSSMAHQAAKLPSKKRKEFISWLDEMEYKVHKIPREDVVVYLYVPWKIGYELTLKKEDRKYTNKKLDIAEADVHHRIESENMYLTLAHERKNWIMIRCVSADGNLLPKEQIHEEIIRALQKKHII